MPSTPKRLVKRRPASKRTAKRKVVRRLSKGKKMTKISLRSNGWSPSLPMGQRHLVLVRMVRGGDDPYEVIRHLRNLATHMRLIDPARYLIYRADAEWAMRNLLLHRLMSSSSSTSKRVVKRKSTGTVKRKKRVVRR